MKVRRKGKDISHRGQLTPQLWTPHKNKSCGCPQCCPITAELSPNMTSAAVVKSLTGSRGRLTVKKSQSVMWGKTSWALFFVHCRLLSLQNSWSFSSRDPVGQRKRAYSCGMGSSREGSLQWQRSLQQRVATVTWCPDERVSPLGGQSNRPCWAPEATFTGPPATSRRQAQTLASRGHRGARVHSGFRPSLGWFPGQRSRNWEKGDSEIKPGLQMTCVVQPSP